MLLSMTGYGSASRASDVAVVEVEARSVNHRFSDLLFRLPRGYQALEESLRPIVAEYVQRGRVEIFVTIEEYRAKERTVRLDRGLLEGYLKAYQAAAELLGSSAAPDVDKLLSFPDVLIVEEEETDVEAVRPLIEEALREALANLVSMRRAEGERLYSDIAHRLEILEQIIQRMAERAPLAVEHYRNRLIERIREWQDEVEVDPSRLALEVALFADKANIDEELTRAQSHIAEFRKICAAGSGVGRKLDFLLQELVREMNTIASKAHDAQLASWVVESKAEIEKIREQVQNIE